jgi:cellulose biosynthesis protein BcsQ
MPKKKQKTTILFCNMKSCGKTTIIRGLAGVLADDGKTTVDIVDFDEAKPDVTGWELLREELPDSKVRNRNISVFIAETANEAAAYAQNSTADYVLIDTEGKATVLKQRKLMSAADYYIIPSLLDLDTRNATINTHRILKESGLPHKCVYTYKAAKPAETRNKAQKLADEGVPLFKNNIRDLSVYQEQAETGMTILELPASNGTLLQKNTHQEMRAFTKELLKTIKTEVGK